MVINHRYYLLSGDCEIKRHVVPVFGYNLYSLTVILYSKVFESSYFFTNITKICPNGGGLSILLYLFNL